MPALDPSTLPPHLLIVSNDVVDHSMAGPGMRYAEMALQLAQSGLQVTLAAPNESKLELHGVQMARYWEDRPATLHVLVENADVALISGYMIEKFPFLAVTETRLVVDLYDPFILENLHYYLEEPIEAQKQLNAHAVDLTNRLARVGDFFLCGNERQRDFWLGVLAANGRVNPLTFQADPSLRSLIDVAGIGFPEREIAPQKRMLRGVHPQIPEDAKIVLWGGGIWNWLDPLTLVQAWPQVVARQPKARLVFLGTRHPNPLVPKHRMADQTIALAQQIGELDHTILFIEWVPYAEREALLAEADLGAALHPIHVETRYSIRTRVLDYIWARLPALITEGDITSEWVARYEIGRVVPPHDADAVANAILEIFERPRHSWAEAFTPLLNTYRWSQIVAPLQRFVINGSVAPDRVIRNPVPAAAPAPYNPWARAMFILRSEGPRALLHRGWRYIQWRLSVRG